jgi:ethanolamine utilization protein EutN
MKLGRVVGKVWSERKVATLEGVRLLVVQPVTGDGRDSGRLLVAADPRGAASSGDTIVYVTSTDAVDAFPGDTPVNASVVMLVDSIT